MTPTPEVSERARALRRRVSIAVTNTAIRSISPKYRARETVETGITEVIEAVVESLGITQEMVDWQEPCCDVPMPGCCSRHEHAIHMVLATLLAAGGNDE